MDPKLSIDNRDAQYQQLLKDVRIMLAHDLTSAASNEHNLCMKGKIRTKEKCPKCNGKFQDTGKALICSACLTTPSRYYIDIYWDQKIKIYSDTDGRVLSSYELASRVLAQIRQEIDHKTFDPKNYQAKSYIPLQFKNYATKWRTTYEELCNRDKISPSYLEKVQIIVNKYFIPHFGLKDIREIRSGDIEDFYLNLPKKLALKTQKNIIDTLHKLFVDAKRRKDIEKVPDFPTIRPDEPKTSWIEEETQDRVYRLIPDQHKPIFLFLFRQGCRPGEARALQVEDIDYENKTVTIQRTFSKGILREKTKSRAIRILPLDDDVFSILRKIRKIKGFVFTDESGKYYHKNKLNKIWNKAVSEVGLSPMKLYEGTRHSFASQAVNRKVPLNLIGDFLGHSNYSMTKRYAKINTEGLKTVLRPKAKVKKLRPQNRGPKEAPSDNPAL